MINAADDVDVNALSRKDVQTYALSIGGGFVGVAGSVSVWTVGTQATSTYNESAGLTDRGIWMSGEDYNTDHFVTDSVDNKRYSPHSDVTNSLVAPHLDLYDPDTDTGTWVPVDKTPLEGETDEGHNNAADDADQVASGDEGYKDSLDGSSTRDQGVWVMGTVYEQGDVVSHAGKKWVAKNRLEHPNSAPNVDPDDEWNEFKGTASDARTTTRINAIFGGGLEQRRQQDRRRRSELADGHGARAEAAAARSLGGDRRHRARRRLRPPPREGRSRPLRHRGTQSQSASWASASQCSCSASRPLPTLASARARSSPPAAARAT